MKKILLLIGILTLSSCAELGISYPGMGRGQGSSPGNSQGVGNGNQQVTVSISVGEARRLAEANGLTGRRALPPGIARNLARGRALPPGIAKQMVPAGMLSGLPRTPDHDWMIIGRDLVLVAIGTAIVVDILNDVFE